MFGKKKNDKKEDLPMQPVGSNQLVDALKKWKAAVEERDNLLRSAYAENKSLRAENAGLKTDLSKVKVERDALKTQVGQIHQEVAGDPPAAPSPEDGSSVPAASSS